MRKVSLTLPGSSHFTILISQMGGLGDVILSARLIGGLRANFPDAKLVLVCRSGFASACDLLPVRPDKVLELQFSPYAWDVPSGELYAALDPVMEALRGLTADLFIAAEHQPTWLSWFLAAQLRPQRAIRASHSGQPRQILPEVLEHFSFEPVELDCISCPADLNEIDRYAAIIRYLGGTVLETGHWVYPEHLNQRVHDKLSDFGLRAGEYLVCFPLGAPGIPVKRWPKERFVEVLKSIRETTPAPVLFIGEESEQVELAEIANQLEDGTARVYGGSPADIVNVAGLIQHARAYLGNDTGPMHLASAYGIGGVAIYGGGHWPAYASRGQGSVAMVHPLPCFGCNWDCLFGHGLCVESISVEAVLAALKRVLAGDVEAPETQLLDSIPESTLVLIRDANARYREAETDRSLRLQSIIELRRNVDVQDDRVEELRRIAAERLRALEAQHAAIEQLRIESDRRREGMTELTMLLDVRDGQIEELEAICLERLAALEKLSASYSELNRQAELRTAGLIELTNHISVRDSRIAELQQVAQERLDALLITHEALERERVTAQERLTALLATDEALRASQAERPPESAVIVDNKENLYKSVLRFVRKFVSKRAPGSLSR